jgi:hypothetical protein
MSIGGNRQNTNFFGNTVRASRRLLTNRIEGLEGTAINISDVICDQGNIYGNLIGDISFPRTINLMSSGGTYNTFQAALTAASALTPTLASPVLIRGFPGTYTTATTLVWPAYVYFQATPGTVILVQTNTAVDAINLSAGTIVLYGLVINGATAASAININNAGTYNVSRCVINNCLRGFNVETVGNNTNISQSATQSGITGEFIRVQNGALCVINNVQMAGSVIALATYTTGTVIAANVLCISCATAVYSTNGGQMNITNTVCRTCATSINVGPTGTLTGIEINCFNCTTDLNVSATATFCNIGNSRFDEAKIITPNQNNISLNINDSLGRDKYFGTAMVYNIQQVDLFGAAESGINQPIKSIFMDDGNNTPVGTALQLSRIGPTYISFPYNAAVAFDNNYTIAFWCNPFPAVNTTQYIMSKASSFELIYLPQVDQLRWFIGGVASITLTSSIILVNQRNFVVTVVDNSNKLCNIYINNVLVSQEAFSGTPITNTNLIRLGNRSSSISSSTAYEGVIDEFNIWNVALNDSQIADQWNNGNGRENSDLTDLVAGYHFDEGSGTTVIDYSPTANNGTTNGRYVDGLINSVKSASVGVLCYLFDPEIEESLFFNCHPEAGFYEGSDIVVYIHWSPMTDEPGDIVFGFEYTFAPVDDVFPKTEIITITEAAPRIEKYHVETKFAGFTLPSYETIVLGRVFRMGNDPGDTYPATVAILSLEFKYLVNKLGADT